ncbi:TraR/DksA family transcriptional regulator [Shewanella algae]|uniref:TraR/DksA family transcriptional regulator n=1 Tax=Shewanella algae TaxID=38313 RepID=UPI0031F49D42
MADVLDIAQEQEERHRVWAINQALRPHSNHSGDGFCVACGEPIPPERLKLQPNASHCVPCLEQEEKRHAR